METEVHDVEGNGLPEGYEPHSNLVVVVKLRIELPHLGDDPLVKLACQIRVTQLRQVDYGIMPLLFTFGLADLLLPKATHGVINKGVLIRSDPAKISLKANRRSSSFKFSRSLPSTNPDFGRSITALYQPHNPTQPLIASWVGNPSGMRRNPPAQCAAVIEAWLPTYLISGSEGEWAGGGVGYRRPGAFG